jgi:hypothetical protein
LPRLKLAQIGQSQLQAALIELAVHRVISATGSHQPQHRPASEEGQIGILPAAGCRRFCNELLPHPPQGGSHLLSTV